MKVMCIDDKQRRDNPIPFKVGDILTAKQCPCFNKNYDIIEYPTLPDGTPCSYSKLRFIPLSDIDETELVKQRESELVNQ